MIPDSRDFELFELMHSRAVDGLVPHRFLEANPTAAFALKLHHRIGLAAGMSMEAAKDSLNEKLRKLVDAGEHAEQIYLTYYGLGECCFWLGELEEAETAWKASLSGKSSEMLNWSRMHLGQLALEREEWEAARQWYEAVTGEENLLLRAERAWGLFRVSLGAGTEEEADRLLMALLVMGHRHRESLALWRERNHDLDPEDRFSQVCALYLKTGLHHWAAELENSLHVQWLPDYKAVIDSVLIKLLEQREYRIWFLALSKCLEEAQSFTEQWPLIQLLKRGLTQSMLQTDTIRRLPGLLEVISKVDQLFNSHYIVSDQLRDVFPELYRSMLRIAWMFGDKALSYELASKLAVWNEYTDNKQEAWVSEIIAEVLQELDFKGEWETSRVYPWHSFLSVMEQSASQLPITFTDVNRLFLMSENAAWRVMVFGVFNNGKSSLINSLIGESVLKAHMLPTTSTIIVLKHSEERKCVRLLHPGELEHIPWEDLKHVTSIQHNASDSGKISYAAIVHLPQTFLERTGMVIIDTPGFDDLNESNEELSLSYAPLADDVIFVLDATRPVTTTESQLIQALQETVSSDRMWFVLNKIDAIDSSERDEVLEHTANALADITGTSAHVLPYSALLAEEQQLKQGLERTLAQRIDKQVLAERHFAQFAASIRSDLRQTIEIRERELKDAKALLEQYSGAARRLEQWIEEWEKANDSARDYIQNGLNHAEKLASSDIKQKFGIYAGEMNQSVDGYSNHETIRNMLYEKGQNLLKTWYRLHARPQLRKAFDAYAKELAGYTGRIMEKLTGAELECQRFWDSLPGQFERPKVVHSKDSAALVRDQRRQIDKFVNEEHSFSTSLVSKDGDFSKFFRGVSSFFSGDGKVLTELKEKLKQEIQANQDKMAGHICWITFLDSKQLRNELNSVIGSPIQAMIQQLEGDLKELQARISSQKDLCHRLQNECREWKQQIIPLELPLHKWERQLREGVLYHNGHLYNVGTYHQDSE